MFRRVPKGVSEEEGMGIRTVKKMNKREERPRESAVSDFLRDRMA